jgi:hypothetical protein
VRSTSRFDDDGMNAVLITLGITVVATTTAVLGWVLTGLDDFAADVADDQGRDGEGLVEAFA